MADVDKDFRGVAYFLFFFCSWFSAADEAGGRSSAVIFVDLPQRRVSRPVANGSKVPPCPIRLIPSMDRAHAANWWLDGPGGLSPRIIPHSRSSPNGLSSGLQPKELLVLAEGSIDQVSGSIIAPVQFGVYFVEHFGLILAICVDNEVIRRHIIQIYPI